LKKSERQSNSHQTHQKQRLCTETFDAFLRLCKNEGNVNLRNILFKNGKNQRSKQSATDMKYFSVAWEETSDNGHVEQLSLSPCFVKTNYIFLYHTLSPLSSRKALVDCTLTNLSQMVLT